MNEFLEYIKECLNYNPQIINADLDYFIYTQLVGYDLPRDEAFSNQEHLFSKWVKRNYNMQGINTFVSSDYPYFCQFKKMDVVPEEAIKLYIPLDKKHLYEGANRLFDYIRSRGFIHASKIGKKIRNDNVVVRVSNMKDAYDIINYVHSDSYIMSGLLKVNPFVVNVGGVGVAKDNSYSYNFELCKALANFICFLKSKNRLNDLSLKGFNTFLEYLKNNSEPELQEIYTLQSIIISRKNMSFNDFKNVVQGFNFEKETILREILANTSKIYGEKMCYDAFTRYLINGDSRGLLDPDNLLSKISKDDVSRLMDYYGYYDTISFVHWILDPTLYLINAYNGTKNKYGKEQADLALKEYIKYGEVKYITNQNNERRELIKNVKYDSLLSMLRNYYNAKSADGTELSEIFLDNISKSKSI